jgi:hypothetical protein
MPQRIKVAPEKYCQFCQKKLERKRYNGTLETLNAFKRRQYCDQTCSDMGQRKAQPTLSALRKRAVAFRGSACECCQATENLAIHHLDSNPANNAPTNLMTLCDSCHTKWHWQNGKKPWSQRSVCKYCNQPSRKLGMCQKHYQRYKNYGDPYLTKRKTRAGWLLVDERPDLSPQGEETI